VTQSAWSKFTGEGDDWRRPGLPLGRVKEVSVSLMNAPAGTTLDVLRAPISSVFCQLVDGTKLLNEMVVRLAIELASGASLAAKSSRG